MLKQHPFRALSVSLASLRQIVKRGGFVRTVADEMVLGWIWESLESGKSIALFGLIDE